MDELATPGAQFQQNRMMVGMAISDTARAMNFVGIAADNCIMADHITADERRRYLEARARIDQAIRDLCNLAVEIHGAATE